MLKKGLLYFAALAFIGLVACGKQQGSLEATVTPAMEITATPVAEATPTEVPKDLPGVSSLTDEEIRYFNEEYFTPESELPGRWVRNNLLYGEFLTPAEADLEAMFYNESMEGELSVEELSYLEEQGAMMEVDLSKLSSEYINELLQMYLGISLEESEKKGLDKFIYYAEQNAYYMVHSDAMACFILVEEGYRNEDGTITLLYRRATEPVIGLSQQALEKLPWYQVVLKETESGYQFLSNQAVVDK